jgi:predicted DCC family thiol-disulfide oxidoreductase YuxK
METTALTVLYDERCAFCVRCRDWLARQPVLVPTELLAAGSAEARARYPGIRVPGKELVVLDQQGLMWTGTGAFIVCLWATASHRALAIRFSRPGWAPLADAFYRQVSRRRDGLSDWLAGVECEVCDDIDRRWEAS